MNPKYLQTIEQITAWCGQENAIEGCILIGSQVRTELPADLWSDLDLMLLVQDPPAWLADNRWLEQFGNPVCTFLEVIEFYFTDWKWIVRRVLYDDNRDIDFSLLPYNRLDEVLRINHDILDRGWQVLYDAHPGQLAAEVTRLLANPLAEHISVPSQAELDELVQNLLFHIIWAFKKIKRKELWTAVRCINSYMRDLLLRLIEAHNLSVTRRSSVIQYEGRFLEKRTDPGIINLLKYCFTRYNEDEAVRTLGRLIDVIHSISAEVFAANGYKLNETPFEAIRKLYFEMEQVE